MPRSCGGGFNLSITRGRSPDIVPSPIERRSPRSPIPCAPETRSAGFLDTTGGRAQLYFVSLGATIARRTRKEIPMEDNDGAKFVYFLMGLGIGALVGILFAPQSGERTRELLTDKADEGRDYLLRKGREVREQASTFVDRGKEVLGQQRDQLAAAIEAGKQAYRVESQPKGTGD